MHPGRGPGLTSRRLGERGGVETVTLTEAQMPNHNHSWRAAEDPADLQAPAPNRTMTRSSVNAWTAPNNLVPLAEQALQDAGGSQAHNNMQPYLVMNFIIALQGLYPSRS
jgi:microcystin-dependent protein